jgi:hypothetical protein
MAISFRLNLDRSRSFRLSSRKLKIKQGRCPSRKTGWQLLLALDGFVPATALVTAGWNLQLCSPVLAISLDELTFLLFEPSKLFLHGMKKTAAGSFRRLNLFHHV